MATTTTRRTKLTAAAGEAQKVTVPGEKTGPRIKRGTVPREQLAPDEDGLPFKCSDCGELIKIGEYVSDEGLCRRCDPEQAGRGDWHQVPEVEPPANWPSLSEKGRTPSVPGIVTPVEIDGFGGTYLWVGRIEGRQPDQWCFGFRIITPIGECRRPVDDSSGTCATRDVAIRAGLVALYEAARRQGCMDSGRLAQLKESCEATAKKHASIGRSREAKHVAGMSETSGVRGDPSAWPDLLPPGATSTTTPAGIREHDPDAGTKASAVRRQAPGKDYSGIGVTVPRSLEPHAVPFPAEASCKAWVEAGQLDSGRWLGRLEAENLATGNRLVASVIQETRDEAFDLAASKLYELAGEDGWPAAANAAIATFCADKPWIARQVRHEALVAAKARNGRAPREASPQERRQESGGRNQAPDARRLTPDDLSSGVARTLSVELGRLGRNRFNPRESFQEADIEELAEELKRDGQIQPVVIRRATGGRLTALVKDGTPEFEIVAGERRALAAVKAGWSQLRAEVIEADDARACRLAIAENKHRKDISQVEYARGLQKLADLTGLDPAGLAKDQGLSDQHVRNLLRLLRTPAEWQQLVIDGKIDGTHLRAAAPYLHVPAIAKELLKDLKREKAKPSAESWRENVYGTVRARGCSLKRYVHTPDYRKSTHVSIDSTHPQYAELDVVELGSIYNDSTTKYALNAKLANKLLDQAESEWKKKAAKQSDRKDAKAAKEKAELTPAERKKHEQEQQRKFQGRLENWFYDWLRVLCAAALKPGGVCENCEQGAQWLIAYALWARPGNHYSELGTAEELAGRKTSKYDLDAIDFLEPRDGHQAAELMHAYAPRLLVEADGSPRGPTSGGNAVIFDRVVTVLARDVLGLDLPAAWKADRRSPMREKYWNLHSKDQLADLGEELGVFIDPKLKKSQAVDVLLAVERPLAVPKELAKLLAKVQPAKKSKVQSLKSKVRKPR